MPEYTDEELKALIQEEINKATNGLKSNRDEILQEKRELAQKLQEIESAESEKTKEALKEAGKYKELLDLRESEFQAKIQNLAKEKEQLAKSFEQTQINSAVTKALADANANATLLAPHITSKVKMLGDENKFLGVVDDFGNTVLDNDGRPMAISKYIESLKENPVFQPAFNISSKGTNQPPNGKSTNPPKSNPYSKESFNYDQIVKLQTTNPELAQQLKAEAEN